MVKEDILLCISGLSQWEQMASRGVLMDRVKKDDTWTQLPQQYSYIGML